MIAPGLQRLRDDRRGATIVEFAIVAPVMMLFLVGAFDIAHSLYLRAAIEGIVQKTARDSGIETASGNLTAIDAKVRNQIVPLVNNGTITITRRFFRTFAQVAASQAENFTDTNTNGRCDAGEPYTDANNNSVWDADGGNAGQGNAKDRAVYTVTVSYPRMLPLDKFIPTFSATQTVTARTVLANQPYSDQAAFTPSTTVRNCP